MRDTDLSEDTYEYSVPELTNEIAVFLSVFINSTHASEILILLTKAEN